MWISQFLNKIKRRHFLRVCWVFLGNNAWMTTFWRQILLKCTRNVQLYMKLNIDWEPIKSVAMERAKVNQTFACFSKLYHYWSDCHAWWFCAGSFPFLHSVIDSVWQQWLWVLWSRTVQVCYFSTNLIHAN